MKRNTFVVISIILATGLLLASCQGLGSTPTAEPGATQVPLAVLDTTLVVEGRLVPSETVQIAFNSSGEVAEVLVEEGDVVESGQVLARLGNRETLESSLANARLELAAAGQELLTAEQALQELSKDLPEAQNAALQAVTSARDELREAERRLNALSTPAQQFDIDEAKANLALAKKALEDAQEDYEPYANKPEDNLVRAAYLSRLASAQRSYDAAVRLVNNLTGTYTNDFDQAQAVAEVEIAQARFDIAEQEYDLLQQGPDPDDVALLQGRIETARQRIEAANAGIRAAEAALNNLELKATIKGTIVEMELIPGQRITPGTPVARIADFSQWYVETDNLTELDVVDVEIGEAAVVSADALSEVEMNAVVERIGDLSEEKRGDITYTVRLRLDNVDPRLRWGMTVVVRFEK
jgi:multidrug resistance efflux pump